MTCAPPTSSSSGTASAASSASASRRWCGQSGRRPWPWNSTASTRKSRRSISTRSTHWRGELALECSSTTVGRSDAGGSTSLIRKPPPCGLRSNEPSERPCGSLADVRSNRPEGRQHALQLLGRGERLQHLAVARVLRAAQDVLPAVGLEHRVADVLVLRGGELAPGVRDE